MTVKNRYGACVRIHRHGRIPNAIRDKKDASIAAARLVAEGNADVGLRGQYGCGHFGQLKHFKRIKGVTLRIGLVFPPR